MSETRTIQRGKALGIAWLFVAAIAGAGFLPRMAQNIVVCGSLWAVALILALGLIALRRRVLTTELHIRRHHFVQIGTQGAIFVYWSLHFEPVADQLWLVGAQILVAYLVDMLLGWWRRGRWLLGFGPFPVVGSINLFLWFRDDWWWLQLVMVALAFLSRPFLRWKRNGRDTHIFNPSAVALVALSLAVLLTDTTDITWGQTIASGLNVPTYMFETLFFVGVVVQVLFDTTLVTMGAALTVWVIGVAYFHLTGWWFFNDTHIPIAVFLGMNLLITDPSTSPVNKTGRFLYGAAYGVLVFPLWTGLLHWGRPVYFDKLIQVPLLNLCVGLFDRLGASIGGRLPQWSLPSSNAFHVLVWAVAFWFLRPGLIDHPNKDVTHGLMLAEGRAGAPKDPTQAAVYFRKACARGSMNGCNNLGLAYLEGVGMTQDLTEAARHFGIDCEGGELNGCTNLAIMRFDGNGVPQDGARAAALYQRGCDGDERTACANLAMMYGTGQGVERDEKRAIDLISRACELRHMGACYELGDKYLRGVTVQQDIAHAMTLFQKACEGKDIEGCAALGRGLQLGQGITQDLPRAKGLLSAACEAKYMPACDHLAAMFALGKGAPRDPKQATIYGAKACDGGYMPACLNLGVMLYQGADGPPDHDGGRKLIERACQGGHQRACEALRQIGGP